MDPILKASLDRGFNPRGIAVVGAKGPNYQWLTASKDYPGGPVSSVQLDENEIPGIEALGIPNYRSLLDVPDPLDYVIIAVPRRIVPRILADCITRGVGLVACYTAGFAETHESEGIEVSDTIARMCREAGLSLVGPNCLCISHPKIGLTSSIGQRTGPGGFAGVLSMSGTHTGNMINLLTHHGMPVSKSVSMGNCIVVDQAEWLQYLGEDEETKVIGMYLEGVREGRKFHDALKDVAARKPVVILKGGQTADGARAATSHTASLASSFDIWRGLFRQTGAIGVDSVDEVVDVAKILMMARPILGTRLGIIASTGGQSVLVSDAAARYGLHVPALTERSYDELRGFFSLTGNSYRNPLDTTGVINTPDQRLRMLEILAADENIDVVVMEMGGFQGRPQGEDQTERLLEVLVEFKEKSPKPLLVIQTGMEEVVQRTRETLAARGIPSIYSFLRAAQALGRARDYYTAQDEIRAPLGSGDSS